MGCDGGSIPRRCEMVREVPKKETKDKNMSRKAKWYNCRITQQRLQEPVMACKRGILYNKEAILEHILEINKSIVAQHVKKSKDVKVLNLAPNPSYQTATKSSSYVPDTQSVSPYVCPLTGIEMNGYHRFGFLWNCGCVFSERAFKEISHNKCLVCSKDFKEGDFIILNDEKWDLPLKVITTSQSASSLNQNVKKSNNSSDVNLSTNKSSINETKVTDDVISDKNKVEKLQDMSKKHTDKSSINKAGKSTNNAQKKQTLSTKNKSDSTVKDPKNSSVYKSLFTSSKSYDANIERKNNHWTTTYSYNL